jgi:hypothetical protein
MHNEYGTPVGRGAANQTIVAPRFQIESDRGGKASVLSYCKSSTTFWHLAWEEAQPMSKLGWLVMFVALSAAPAAAQDTPPDMRGTWKGDSESIVLGRGNPHHAGPKVNMPRLSSIPFTMTIDMQDGRRFSGKFSSPKSSESIIAVISHAGTIYMVDDDGWTSGTMLAPGKMELCYMARIRDDRVASCTVMTKQP